MKEEFYNRVWNIFIKRKIKEISIALLILCSSVLICYILGIIDFLGINERYLEGLNPEIWMYVLLGIPYLFLLSCLILFLLLLIFIIKEWLNSNWEESVKQAKKELNERNN